MKVVGLTGGIATGKSTVARLLRERHGAVVVDLDQVAREVVAPGTAGLAAIRDRFGSGVMRDDGSLDRSALRRVIATDGVARKDLEAITHPLIRLEAARRLQELALQGVTLAFVEAALMVETGSYTGYAALVVVSCSPETQLRRLVERDGQPLAEARALIAAQLPMAEKERVATHVIRNDGTLDELIARVDAVWDALQGAW